MAQHRRDWLAGGDRRAAAVARIEAAATELFLERGIDDVGVDEVAARAGCSRATLYRHVGGKAALVDAVLARSAVTVSERVAAAVAPHAGPRRVVEAILASVAAIRADPVLSRWLATRSAAGDGYLTASPVLSRIAATLTRTADDEAAMDRPRRAVTAHLAAPGRGHRTPLGPAFRRPGFRCPSVRPGWVRPAAFVSCPRIGRATASRDGRWLQQAPGLQQVRHVGGQRCDGVRQVQRRRSEIDDVHVFLLMRPDPLPTVVTVQTGGIRLSDESRRDLRPISARVDGPAADGHAPELGVATALAQ